MTMTYVLTVEVIHGAGQYVSLIVMSITQSRNSLSFMRICLDVKWVKGQNGHLFSMSSLIAGKGSNY